MAFVEVRNVSKSFASTKGSRDVLSGIHLSVEEGEFVSIVGCMGSGKSTFMNILSGLMKADSGTVTIGGQPVTGIHPKASVVFQNYSLLPWFSALENVRLAVEAAHSEWPRSQQIEQSRKFLETVGLGNALHKRPSQLSGGMRQRVAIARAFATEPSILFMDEPFSALDALTREEMQRFLVDVWKETKKTVVYVTHNVAEAVYLADRVIVFSPHPGTVKAQVKIALPRPRDTLSVEFLEYQKEIVSHIVERK